jgi:hypothetical protein
MDHNQLYVLAIANVPTMITVLIGILLNNARFNDLNLRMTSMEGRLGGMETRFNSFENRIEIRISNLETKFDTRFDLLLSKVVEIDNRLTRIEAQGR